MGIFDIDLADAYAILVCEFDEIGTLLELAFSQLGQRQT
jgi:hypothetical protein